MPNWCYTSYKIVGKRSDVEQIDNAIRNHPCCDDSEENWQGNILAALGMKDFEKRSIRGFILDHDYMGNVGEGMAQLNIYCDEAWCRTEFAELLQEKFPDISIYWMAEESGCGYYQTNDREGGFFPERYYVDTCIGGCYDSEYFTSEAEAYEWISQRTDCESTEDVKAWNEAREKADSDDFIYVHEFEVV